MEAVIQAQGAGLATVMPGQSWTQLNGRVRFAVGEVPFSGIAAKIDVVVAVMPRVRGMLVEQAHVVLAGVTGEVQVEPAFASDMPLRLRVVAQHPEPDSALDATSEVRLVVAVEERG